MKALLMATALMMLAGCNQSSPTSNADAASGASAKSSLDKEFGNLNTGRVVHSGGSGDCDAACQSRIKK
ncbi:MULTISPECIES: hypothetical protein [unclassified Caballeronia]|uniref:hypothetical protein n=1 Tax=unclassified Caballeronia TaxID=2646786 RepID=UPI002855E319|nr:MULTISPECIES: hypothetical protein [unclassified Caballeronia]MDR5777011.1 hypothetical protein [Caballeronia sp. LZ002]MDR5852414.1 hypothetical protein [Caballeronia sp. LZ003]